MILGEGDVLAAEVLSGWGGSRGVVRSVLRRATSICSVGDQHDLDRLEDDRDVSQKGPVLDVPEVESDGFLEW